MSKLSVETTNFETYSFRTIIPTRFSDVNAANHVSNIAIIHMFEDARARFYEKLGIEIVGKNYVLMIVSNLTNYYAECQWPTDFEVFCKISKIGNSSFEISQLGRQNGTNIAALNMVSVYTENGKAKPIPKDFRRALLA